MMVDWTISGASGETDEPAKTQLLVYFQIVWTGKIIQQYQIQYKYNNNTALSCSLIFQTVTRKEPKHCL